MLNFFKTFLNFNERELTRLRKQVVQINALEEKVTGLKDSAFPRETVQLKEHIQGDKNKLEEYLPYAYALVREAARRVLGERHYDVQLMAGIALHEGKVAEQKTGEGKTLSSTTPLYLNALLGRGVHLVTVNDYLARRDAGWMGMVFDFLGLTTTAIIAEKSFIFDREYLDKDASDWRLQHLRPISRREAYLADITYGINSEFGFDYLRDNMSYSSRDASQRDFYYAIIDEVDSVLIDEARTPHIISAPYDDDVSRYYEYAKLVGRLMGESDYVIDEKLRTANLTEHGIEKVEKMLGLENIYEQNYDSLFHIEAALKARTLFKKDKDYIIREGEVIIVDEFTGRLLEGRRFSEGIHQAIEAKEAVSIKKESRTLATISLQNYFRQYDKLAGMTGTAVTEAEEFNKIYGLEVIVIPTNRSIVRRDRPDFIYKTERGKFTALVEEIAEVNKKGQPVLVGTTSIEKNETLSALLRRKGVRHELLNAKNHLREAIIIADAGKKGAVTIATNMAGRGVDIVLGGEAPNRYEKNKSKQEYDKEKKEWKKQHNEVVELGGLYVIGTERHDSRRIDNQLRGRSGRQGDPGKTRFFISLEDDMLRVFGGEQIKKMMSFLNFPENQPIEHGMVSKAIEQAQVKVEGFNFDIRKHMLEFDDVLNKQREIIYKQRRRVIELAEAGGGEFDEFVENQVNKLLDNYTAPLEHGSEEQKEEAMKFLEGTFFIKEEDKKALRELSPHQFGVQLERTVRGIVANKKERFGQELFREGVKVLYLSTIDHYFTQHLTSIDELREGINLRGYAQLDPLNEYKKESFTFFNNLVTSIRTDFFRRLMHLEIQANETRSEARKQLEQSVERPKKSKTNAPASEVSTIRKTAKTAKKKLGRNDSCWCGSGKKWKKCHYPKLAE